MQTRDEIYLTTYSADLPNRPKYLGYSKKGSHWVSVVRDLDYEKSFPSFFFLLLSDTMVNQTISFQAPHNCDKVFESYEGG